MNNTASSNGFSSGFNWYVPAPMRETLASETPTMRPSARFEIPSRPAARNAALVTTAPSDTAGRMAARGMRNHSLLQKYYNIKLAPETTAKWGVDVIRLLRINESAVSIVNQDDVVSSDLLCGIGWLPKQLTARSRRHRNDARVLEPALRGDHVVPLADGVRSPHYADAVQPADVAFDGGRRGKDTPDRLTEHIHQRGVLEFSLDTGSNAFTIEPFLQRAAQRIVGRRQDDGRILQRPGEPPTDPRGQSRWRKE